MNDLRLRKKLSEKTLLQCDPGLLFTSGITPLWWNGKPLPFQSFPVIIWYRWPWQMIGSLWIPIHV